MWYICRWAGINACCWRMGSLALYVATAGGTNAPTLRNTPKRQILLFVLCSARHRKRNVLNCKTLRDECGPVARYVAHAPACAPCICSGRLFVPRTYIVRPSAHTRKRMWCPPSLQPLLLFREALVLAITVVGSMAISSRVGGCGVHPAVPTLSCIMSAIISSCRRKGSS